MSRAVLCALEMLYRYNTEPIGACPAAYMRALVMAEAVLTDAGLKVSPATDALALVE